MVLEYLPTFARIKPPSHVGKYTSTMEHMGYGSFTKAMLDFDIIHPRGPTQTVSVVSSFYSFEMVLDMNQWLDSREIKGYVACCRMSSSNCTTSSSHEDSIIFFGEINAGVVEIYWVFHEDMIGYKPTYAMA